MRDWLKLHVVLIDNIKVMAQLSSDAARWHYVKALVHAKKASPEGEWRNRDYFRFAVGPETYAYLDEFMSTRPEGLIVEDEDGTLRIRQWDYWQASESVLERVALDVDALERRRQSEREASKRYRGRQKAKNRPPSYDASCGETDRQSVSASDDARLERAVTDSSDEGWVTRPCGYGCGYPVFEAEEGTWELSYPNGRDAFEVFHLTCPDQR
jgi:hypothetical protein